MLHFVTHAVSSWKSLTNGSLRSAFVRSDAQQKSFLRSLFASQLKLQGSTQSTCFTSLRNSFALKNQQLPLCFTPLRMQSAVGNRSQMALYVPPLFAMMLIKRASYGRFLLRNQVFFKKYKQFCTFRLISVFLR